MGGFGGLGYSSFGMGFGSPFYSPYYGSSFGYSPFGYGGYYDPFYSSYAYGYGGYGGYYSPFYSPFGYGYGSYYGSSIYANNVYISGADPYRSNRSYGPRFSNSNNGAVSRSGRYNDAFVNTPRSTPNGGRSGAYTGGGSPSANTAGGSNNGYYASPRANSRGTYYYDNSAGNGARVGNANGNATSTVPSYSSGNNGYYSSPRQSNRGSYTPTAVIMVAVVHGVVSVNPAQAINSHRSKTGAALVRVNRVIVSQVNLAAVSANRALALLATAVVVVDSQVVVAGAEVTSVVVADAVLVN